MSEIEPITFNDFVCEKYSGIPIIMLDIPKTKREYNKYLKEFEREHKWKKEEEEFWSKK